MQEQIKKLTKNIKPIVEAVFKFIVSTLFELAMFASLGYCTMLLIAAAPIVEYVVAGIVVFSAMYFTKIWK